MPPLTSAPTLTTDRITLRGPHRDDLQPLTKFMTSAPSMQAQNETVSAVQAWFGFLAGVGHWHYHGFGFFALVHHDTGHPLGRVGLIKHSNWPKIELAWHLFEGAEGQGFATEAALAVRRWAHTDLGLAGSSAILTLAMPAHRAWPKGSGRQPMAPAPHMNPMPKSGCIHQKTPEPLTPRRPVHVKDPGAKCIASYPAPIVPRSGIFC